jgi:biotin carboxylase
VQVSRDNDGVLLVIGSGRQLYRDYLIKGLAQRAALWLIDDRPPTWQRPFIAGSTVVRALDDVGVVPDQPALIEAATRIAQDRKVAGVVTYDEMLVIAAAHVAEALGMPGLTASGALNCRDKHRSRMALSAAGLAQPRFALVHSLDQARAAADRIGYPLVIKPRGLAASIGVVRVTASPDLAAAFEAVAQIVGAGPPDLAGGVLLEELVSGPEISIDAALSGGDYRPFCLARKQLGPEPYFEETGHVVVPGEQLTPGDELWKLLARAHEALGVPDGVTHTEVKLTPGGPVIIEVNGRLGGDMIPYLGLLATGVDPGQVAADIALGTPPVIQPRGQACAAVRFLYPPADCRVAGVSVPSPGQVPGLAATRALASAGSILRLPPRAHLGRHAFLIATGDAPRACERVLDEAAGLVRLRYEPLEDQPRSAGRNSQGENT